MIRVIHKSSQCDKCPHLGKGVFPYCREKFRSITISEGRDYPDWCPIHKKR